MTDKQEVTEGLTLKEENRLKYKPLKDSLLIGLSVFIVVAIILIAIFAKPKTDNVHVEIRYNSTLLWDKNDPTKDTAISFPVTGEKVLQFYKDDGPIYLGEGNKFDFYGDLVEITLFSNKSIKITKEDSPRHICSNLGRIYTTYTPLVCLPNKIQATIVADSGFPRYDN